MGKTWHKKRDDWEDESNDDDFRRRREENKQRRDRAKTRREIDVTDEYEDTKPRKI